MKLRYLIGCILIVITVACSKNNSVVNPGGGGKDTTGTTDTTDTTQPPSQPDTISIEQALFTNPALTNTKQSSPRIMNALINYLDNTPKGADVHISIYLFYYEPVVNAVADAAIRGVNVHVLINGGRGKSTGKNESTYQRFKRVFGKSSDVTWVFNDAAPSGTEAIDHEKYAIFSEVDLPQGVAKNLVFGTSHNFTTNGTKKAQDAVVMTNKALYDIFLANWKEVKSRAASGMKNFEYTVKDVGDSVRVFFFPRRENGKWDGKKTIIEQLDKLNKSGYAQDTVRVLMASWSGNYGIHIAQKLTALEEDGVTVQVIARSSASSAVKTELQKLKDEGGYLKIINTSTQGEHSKTMLIKGMWDGKQKQQIILTGSHNYTSYALKYNDEFLFRLTNSALFNDYWSNWNEVQKDY
jgi:phosphatidylserine/phosphatidylglycerophosphate/cardiolipin synthase-like enzyme